MAISLYASPGPRLTGGWLAHWTACGPRWLVSGSNATRRRRTRRRRADSLILFPDEHQPEMWLTAQGSGTGVRVGGGRRAVPRVGLAGRFDRRGMRGRE